MPNLIDNKVLNEILTSEKSYKSTIDTLVESLDRPIFGTVLEELAVRFKQFQIISSNVIENITNTIDELTKELPNDNERMMLSIERITLLNTFFNHYDLYLPVFKDLQNLLEDPNNDLNILDQEISNKTMGLGLASLIIQPLQRSMRYEMLIKTLLETAQSEDSIDDYQVGLISSLYEQAKELNVQVNESQCQDELEAQRLAKEEQGYQFGDIFSGNYSFGDFTQRFRHTFWSEETSVPNDSMIFELIDEEKTETEIETKDNINTI